MNTNKLLLILLFTLLSCTKDDPSQSGPQSEDCAGSSGGEAVCGCTDSTAYNYDSNATHDDGSCQTFVDNGDYYFCLLYTSPSPRDRQKSRMPSSA